MEIESILAQRINIADVRRLAVWAAETYANRCRLWALVSNAARRVSVNALWVVTYLLRSEAEWVASLREEMIDMLLAESDASKKRMLLKILREQEYEAENVRADFLDWCLSKINSECEPYAVRAFAIYIAFKMCRFYPELLFELKQHLAMLSQQTLMPGLACARSKTLGAIKKIESNSAICGRRAT